MSVLFFVFVYRNTVSWSGLRMHDVHVCASQKAPFVLRTIEEQMEMIRGSEPRSLFIRLIQRVPFYQKGTKNIVLNQSSLH